MDGVTLCREIRARSVVPIVLLSARSDPIDVVVGLEAGADDYRDEGEVWTVYTPPNDLERVTAALTRNRRVMSSRFRVTS